MKSKRNKQQRPATVRWSDLVRRVAYWLIDKTLNRLTLRPMYARKPVKKIVVYLLAEKPDGPIMEQWDWEITAAEYPRIAELNGFTLALEVAEEGYTQPNLAGSAHLSPGIPLFSSLCKCASQSECDPKDARSN